MRGSALIIVLSFLVLLTGLVVMFLSRALNDRKISASSVNLTKAEVLAHSVLNSLVADFKTEIYQNSADPWRDRGVFDPKPTLTPSGTAWLVEPTRSGTANPNLVRYSGDGDPADAFPTRATTVSSTTPSANGRFVTPTRWNLHYLNPLAVSTGTAAEPHPDTFTPPHWVLVTGSGPAQLPALAPAHKVGGAEQVIARYAFAVYDEGGLLDANVAGYPASLSAALLGRKGTPALADIGLAIGGADAMNKLVGWRNHATAAADGDLLNGYQFANSGSAYAAWLFPYMSGTVSGTVPAFVTVSATTRNNRTDQQFPSRQSLIKFQQAAWQRDGTFPASALQYLGTHTRALNRPNFTPRAVSPLIVSATVSYTNGGDDAAVKSANPIVQRVLRADGSAVAKQRFPLSRLNLFPPPSAPSPTTEQAGLIYKWFGLTHAGGPVWEYGGGGRVAKRILNLSEVPADREPDFFELLQAAILEGSLWADDSNWIREKSGQQLATYPAQVILQIGANLISQAQPHNIPVTIKLPAVGSYSVSVTGLADLPYFSEVLFWPYRPSEGASISSIGKAGGGGVPDIPVSVAGVPDLREKLHAWLVFELWNPHRSPSAPAGVTPRQIRLHYRSQSGLRYKCREYKWNGTSYAMTQAIENSLTFSGAMTQQLTLTLAADDYREPALLADSKLERAAEDSAFFHTVSDQGKPARVGLWLGQIADDTPDREFIKKLVAAGQLGAAFLPDYAYSWMDFTEDSAIKGSVALQYKHPNGEWYYYQGAGMGLMTSREDDLTRVAAGIQQSGVVSEGNIPPTGKITGSPWVPATVSAQYTDFDYMIGNSVQRADPRVTLSPRGSFAAQSTPDKTIRPDSTAGATARFNYTVGPEKYAEPFSKDGGDTVPAGSHRPYPGASWENTADGDAATRTYLVDADGVLRCGDGGKNAPSVYTSTTARPVFLHRPLHSVAEMGYASRGYGAWKSLNFFSKESADAGLLDFFSADDEPVTAGKINLNTRQPLTLKAALIGAYRDAESGDHLTDSEAEQLAAAIVKHTAAQPLVSRADLVRELLADSDIVAVINSVSGGGVKSRREAFVRALADVGTTRTWNLMIDVVAQTGRYLPGARTFADFTVEGEKHYWLHVALDRYTGEVISQQLEEVNE